MNIEMTLDEKFDAMANGQIVEFTPEEAEMMGAFQETALSEKDALEARDKPRESSDQPSNIVFSLPEKLECPKFYTLPEK